MTPVHHRKNIELVRELLAGAARSAETDDPVYRTLFHAQFIACCLPLALLAWVNPDNEGVFIRIVFPATGVAPTAELLAGLNAINEHLPVGCFVLTQAGEVRFKSAVFVGDAVAPRSILENLFASAADMVRVEYSRIAQLLTGSEHAH
jgi:hypothetical protein